MGTLRLAGAQRDAYLAEHLMREEYGVGVPYGSEDSATSYLRWVLRQEGHPRADDAFVRFNARPDTTALGWDTEVLPWVPFIDLSRNMAWDTTILHEVAHALAQRPFEHRDADLTHGEKWVREYVRLLKAYLRRAPQAGDFLAHLLLGAPDPRTAAKTANVRYFHGTSQVLTEVTPADAPVHQASEPGWAYATTSEQAAWHYANAAYRSQGGKRRVYEVVPTGEVEEDPNRYFAGMDVRSRSPFTVVREVVKGKTALPSWRDRGRHPEADCVIAPDLGRSRGNYYAVFTYGQQMGRASTLREAKEMVEEVYGPQKWLKVPGDRTPKHDPVWGLTTEFNDAPYYLIVERLPMLGATAGWAKAGSRTAAYDDHIARGLALWTDPEVVPADRTLMQKIVAGTATARDFLASLTHHDGLGVWWGVMGSFGDLADFQEYAYSGGTDSLLRAVSEEDEDYLESPCAIEVVLIAKRPRRNGQPWDPEVHNESNALMGNSELVRGETIELTEIRYNAGWGWKTIPAQGLRATAGVAQGLRVEAAQGVRVFHGTTEAAWADILVSGFKPTNLLKFVHQIEDEFGLPRGSVWKGQSWSKDRRKQGTDKHFYVTTHREIAEAYSHAGSAPLYDALQQAYRLLHPEARKGGLFPYWEGEAAWIVREINKRGGKPVVIEFDLPPAVVLQAAENTPGWADQPERFLEWVQSRAVDSRTDAELGFPPEVAKDLRKYVTRVTVGERPSRIKPRGAGKNGDLPEGLTFKRTEGRGWRSIEAFDGGKAAGSLVWATDPGDFALEEGEIENVGVEEAYQRRGLATELLRQAREWDPRVHHSENLTGSGRAWSQRVAFKGLTFERKDYGTTGCILAYHQGENIAGINWDKATGEVTWVTVADAYQRNGIATELYRRAKEADPRVHHSGHQTDEGTAWARTTGSLGQTTLYRGMVLHEDEIAKIVSGAPAGRFWADRIEFTDTYSRPDISGPQYLKPGYHPVRLTGVPLSEPDLKGQHTDYPNEWVWHDGQGVRTTKVEVFIDGSWQTVTTSNLRGVLSSRDQSRAGDAEPRGGAASGGGSRRVAGPASGRVRRERVLTGVSVRDARRARPVEIEGISRGEFARLDKNWQKLVAKALRDLEAGKANPEQKQRPPLEDCFSLRVGPANSGFRVVFFIGIDGKFHVFYLGFHDYAQAEKRMGAADVTYREMRTDDIKDVVAWAYVGDERGIEAVAAGQRVGHLIWEDTKGEIQDVAVTRSRRRQGIATAMLAEARKISPHVHHSDALTPDGEAWSQRVAATLPRGVTIVDKGVRQDIHRLEAHRDGEMIGYLMFADWDASPVNTWDADGKIITIPGNTHPGNGVIADVWVDASARRQGVANALLMYARTLLPQVHHNTDLTPAGRAWSRAVGARVEFTDTPTSWSEPLYRGTAILVSEEEAAFLFDTSKSAGVRGEKVLELVERDRSSGRRSTRGGLGRHWATTPEGARHFAFMSGTSLATGTDRFANGGVPVSVLITIDPPEDRAIEDDERVMRDKGVQGYAAEKEVPLKAGASINVHAVEWWDATNRNRKGSIWGPPGSGLRKKATSWTRGTHLYRGYNVRFPADLEKRIWDLSQPPETAEQIDQHLKIGPLVVDYLMRGHQTPYGRVSLGRHWTSNRRMAEIAAQQGAQGGWGVILEIKDEGQESDPDATMQGAFYRDSGTEQETNLRPGTPVTVTGVYLPGLSGWDRENLLATPLRKTAMPVGPPPPGVRYLFTSNNPRNPQRSYCMLGAFLGDEMIGYMTWGLQGRKIASVWVDPTYRRRRIAASMLERARTVDPGIAHHLDRTDEGDAWARAISPDAPVRENNTTTDEYERPTSGRLIKERLLTTDKRDVGEVRDLSRAAARAAKTEVRNGITYKVYFVENEGQVFAEDAQGYEIGGLRWDCDAEPPTVIDMSVDEAHRRKGIATAMWEVAKSVYPSLQHSDVLTPEGRAWSQTVSARTAALSLEDTISVAEEVMERSGQAGKVWDCNYKMNLDIDHRSEGPHRPVHAFVADVLRGAGLPEQTATHIRVRPKDWNAQGAQAVTDGMNYIGLGGYETTTMTLLHECAHIINRTGEGEGHDAAFARLLRGLYAKHISPAAAETFWDLVGPKVEGTRAAALRRQAEADVEDGVMVALVPPLEVCRALVEHDAATEPLENQHITLVYPGKVADIDRDAIHKAVEDWASRAQPLTGKVSGYGTFVSEEGGVLYASWDLPESGAWRESLVQALRDGGLDWEETHGWTPHQTLAYEDEPITTLPPVPDGLLDEVTFNSVVVAYGGEWTSFALKGDPLE